MAGFFTKLKGATATSAGATNNASSKHKKEEPAPELTPMEKMLQNAGPIRQDGADKFFGMENFGNTCYCNSIVQALYYSDTFRDNVINYPSLADSDGTNGTNGTHVKTPRVKVTIRPPMQPSATAANDAKAQKGLTTSQALKQRQAINMGQMPPGLQPVRPEDKPDSPEYKKKQAMIKGPVLELVQDGTTRAEADENTFTALRDIFTALIESESRTGVMSPQRFLNVFKRDNEMFRNSMHQDAHEFYGMVLNDVISSVEADAKRMQEDELRTALARSIKSQGTGWVHDIFEGVLTSETRCLTCETASQREETFLDLSIDLEEHSSVTSCLQKFSAEEMLCERNKFHCDHCGGLQEAEKRMKVKKLPKILALHLKRFKYTEDYSRLQKLFHRVVYPYYLRMFNTSDEAEDPDRLYELYAVVIHIGGNAYHGHYVSVIKTKDRGWVLFDDEMVEPVDKNFVMNFFGDRPGMACAYVLFYQETTFEKMRAEQEAEGLEEVRLASQKADLALEPNGLGATSPLSKLHTAQPISPMTEDRDMFATLAHANTAPGEAQSPGDTVPSVPIPREAHPMAAAPPPAPAVMTKADEAATVPATLQTSQTSKEDKQREKKEQKAAEKAAEKEQKAAEKARKAAEKEQAKQADKERAERLARTREAQLAEHEQLTRALQESKDLAKDLAREEERKRNEDSSVGNGNGHEVSSKGSFLNRANRGSKSLSRKSFSFLSKDKNGPASPALPDSVLHNGHGPTGSPALGADKQDKPLKDRFNFSLGRKKSEKTLI